MQLLRLFRGKGASVLGPLESRVMDVVWSHKEPVSVGDVHSALRKKGRKLSYSTVKAVLTNLASKGHLRKRSEGRSNSFAAVASKEEFKERVVKQVLDSLIGEHRDPLLAHLVDDLAVDEESLAKLEELLAKKRAELKL
jgi:predicted transcriptional regulator